MSGFPLIFLKNDVVGINYCIDIVTFIESENTDLCILTGCGVRVFCVMCYVFERFSIDFNKSVVLRVTFRIFSRCTVFKFNSQYKFV